MQSTYHGNGWTLHMEREMTEITSEFPSPDERWTFTDAAGHEHRYERGYPTLEEVITAQHWCDRREGLYSHDPHKAVDESHFECRICREVIVPAMHPPYRTQFIPGLVSFTIEGRRSDGAEIEAWLIPAEAEAIQTASDFDTAAVAVLDAIPQDRIRSFTFASR